jgi:hypothetical protein
VKLQDIDLVIQTPGNGMSIALAAMNAGKHVAIEVPVAQR